MSEKKNSKLSAISLQSAVEAVVAQANAKGIDITTEALLKLVKTHAAGAAASMAAMGALPGAGSAIAAGAEIGFVWSMYYRICTRLGINIKKEILKTLGSAIITNIAGSITAELIVGTVLSIIPGIGTVGAAALNGLMGYSVTYYSGIIFMNLLVRVFKAGGKLEDLSADDLKDIANEEVKATSFADIKEEAKAAYKNRKKDGVAEAIEDEDAPAPIPLQPKHRYWLQVGIDFGSTNSVMAWRLYRWTDENRWVVDEQCNLKNNIVRCPTMLVYKRDNPEHPVVQAEPGEVAIGKRAEELANDSQEPAAAVTGFKSAFYDEPEGSEAHQAALGHIALFMGHLYRLYEGEILACLPNQVRGDMSVTVHISTPVRANRAHRDCMVEMARRAGFANDGDSCFIDTSRNEAECVMHLTIDENIDSMRRLMEMSMAKSALNILFIDVGGSTTDIELIKQEMHSAGKSAQVLAMWPRGNVQYMLGGQEIDRALFEYLLDNECLIPEFANASWERGTARTLFRKLKENNNARLKDGGVIASLGSIRTACGDPEDEEHPRNKYKDHRITKEIFEQVVCKRYIEDLTSALHDVLRGSVGEDEVDVVFLTGAGSRLYFIHDLILGRLGDNPLQLTQLQNDETRLFDHFRDPATCCAEGAISGIS